MQRKIFCEQANQMDLVNYLEKLGYPHKKIINNDYWYLSPFRIEKTPSFKVNRKMNVWYDHGIGKGGSFVDFGILFHQCTVKELLEKLTNNNGLILSFQPRAFLSDGEKKDPLNHAGKINIISSGEIIEYKLQEYIRQRHIPLSIANKFCHEVCFELYGNKHKAVGFKNVNGGYELRNHYFKGSSSPKEPKLICNNNEQELFVFEGFFDFLSFETMKISNHENIIQFPKSQEATLVLNSLSFFEKSRDLMEKYSKIHLFLDRDLMGIKHTNQALKWSGKYQDQSKFYRGFKDMNEYLVKSANLKLRNNHKLGKQYFKNFSNQHT